MAVIGGGLTGTCVALELADAGLDVVLVERAQQVLAGASHNGEGKIHLGYVYALGPPATTRAMIRGALRFGPILGRWLPSSVLDDAVSDPFLYAVPGDSMVPAAGIEEHFDRVEQILAEELAAPGARYVAPLWPWRRMSDTERTDLFAGDRVVAAYETAERAVDPERICPALRDVVMGADGVEVRCGTEVTGVREREAGVEVQADGTWEQFDLVVNCAWEDRLRLDATYGLAPGRRVIHRFKTGMRAGLPAGQTLPTVTFTSGCYGDTVAYAASAYASWYPVGLLSQEVALHPSARYPMPDELEQRRLVDQSAAGLAELMPAIEPVLTESDWRVVGGYITAWGETGIDDIGSRLHSRHEIGVHAHRRYLTVDTGKLTTAPMWADHVASIAADTLQH